MITDPTAIDFSNRKLRPAADRLAQINYWFESIIDELAKREEQDPAFIPDDATVMDDGADTDGRPVVTGAQLQQLVVLMRGYRAQFAGVMSDILAIAVNPHPGTDRGV